jgi:hypothetical protein
MALLFFQHIPLLVLKQFRPLLLKKLCPMLLNCLPRDDSVRERRPNWELQEILAFISAKQEKFLERLQVTNAHELFDLETTHWQRVSISVIRVGFSPVVHDGGACKKKWNLLALDYKRISNLHKRTRTNKLAYWTMFGAKKRDQRLPKAFNH